MNSCIADTHSRWRGTRAQRNRNQGQAPIAREPVTAPAVSDPPERYGAPRICRSERRRYVARRSLSTSGVRLELVGPASRVAAASWAAAVATPAARTLVRLADVQGPPLQLAPVQVGDRLLRLSRGAHLDETEAPRPSGRAIRDDGRRLARSGLAEEGLEVRAGGVEGKISDEQLLAHTHSCPMRGVWILSPLPEREADRRWTGRGRAHTKRTIVELHEGPCEARSGERDGRSVSPPPPSYRRRPRLPGHILDSGAARCESAGRRTRAFPRPPARGSPRRCTSGARGDRRSPRRTGSRLPARARRRAARRRSVSGGAGGGVA